MTTELKRIAGSGGIVGGSGKGGGSGSAPKDAPDSLKSKSYASALFAISEGPIRGFVDADPLKSVYLNDTPIRSTAGVDYFQGCSYDFRLGTPDQTVMPNFGQVRQSYAVGTKVLFGAPVTRTLIDSQANFASVRVRIPSLFSADNSKGEIRATSLMFRIDISTNGGPFVPIQRPNYVDKKTNAGFEQAWLIYLPPNPQNRWDIRVTRLIPDSTNVKIQNDLIFQSFESVHYGSKSFPNTAVLGLRLDSENFSSIPSVSADLYGLIVKVPSNYDPINATYSGSFNGSLVPGWSDNPAWILYDVLTSERYGYGISANLIDVYSFYSASIYNDQRIPNLEGGFSRRFTFNCYFDQRQQAHELVNSILGSFRANLVWQNGRVVLLQDRPTEASRIYGPSNTVREIDDNGIEGPAFNYEQADLNSVYTAVSVKWFNPDLGYKQDVEYCEDAAAIARFGYRLSEIEAVGCTNRTEARRAAEWALYTALRQNKLLSFKVPSEGMSLQPLETILINDPSVAGDQRLSGRISDVLGPASVLLDSQVTIESGKTYRLSTLNPDGRQTTYAVANSPGTTDRISVLGAFNSMPTIGTFWMLQSNTVQAQSFQVLKITEDGSGDYELQCANYEAGKFDYVERDIPLPQIPISDLPRGNPSAPTAIQTFESLIETTLGVKNKLQVFWNQAESWIAKWEVDYRLQGEPISGSPTSSTIAFSTSAEFTDLAPGTYIFQVRGVSQTGVYTPVSSQTVTIYGLTAPPVALSNCTISGDGSSARLSWDLSADLDVRIGGRIQIGHSPLVGADWSSCSLLSEVAGTATSCDVALIEGSYLVRAIDSGGRVGPAVVISTTGLAVLKGNIVAQRTESPTFAGTKTNCSVTGGRLVITDLNIGSAVYEFAGAPIDLGTIQSCKIVGLVDSSILDASNSQLWDAASGLFDDRPGLFDGNPDPNGASALLQVSISQDGTTYGTWQRLIAGSYSGRSFKFRLLVTNQPDANYSVGQLGVTVDMPDRVEAGTNAIGSGAPTRINFSRAYKQAPSGIAVTIQNGQSGNYAVVSGIDASGFSCQTFNSGSTVVSRSVSWSTKSF